MNGPPCLGPRAMRCGFTHRLAQLRPMSAKPVTCFAIPGTRRRHQPPVRRRVIEPLEVHQLMNHHVVAHPFGHGDESPIEADMTVPPARTPSRPLIANADPRDAQAVLVGELAQPMRELRSAPGPCSRCDRRAEKRPRDNSRALPRRPSRRGVARRRRLPAASRREEWSRGRARRIRREAGIGAPGDGARNRWGRSGCSRVSVRSSGGGRCPPANGSPSCTTTGYPIQSAALTAPASLVLFLSH